MKNYFYDVLSVFVAVLKFLGIAILFFYNLLIPMLIYTLLYLNDVNIVMNVIISSFVSTATVCLTLPLIKIIILTFDDENNPY